MCCICEALWIKKKQKQKQKGPGASSWLQGMADNRHADPCMPYNGTLRGFIHSTLRWSLWGRKQLSRNYRIYKKITEGTWAQRCDEEVLTWLVGRRDKGRKYKEENWKKSLPFLEHSELYVWTKGDGKNKSLRSSLGSFKGPCV